MHGLRWATGALCPRREAWVNFQYQNTSREIAEVRARLQHAEREARRGRLTEEHVTGLEATTSLYQSVGKMFVLRPREEILTSLAAQKAADTNKAKDLQKKSDFLQRRLESLGSNLGELAGS